MSSLDKGTYPSGMLEPLIKRFAIDENWPRFAGLLE
jgi:hypothetical protein